MRFAEAQTVCSPFKVHRTDHLLGVLSEIPDTSHSVSYLWQTVSGAHFSAVLLSALTGFYLYGFCEAYYANVDGIS